MIAGRARLHRLDARGLAAQLSRARGRQPHRLAQPQIASAAAAHAAEAEQQRILRQLLNAVGELGHFARREFCQRRRHSADEALLGVFLHQRPVLKPCDDELPDPLFQRHCGQIGRGFSTDRRPAASEEQCSAFLQEASAGDGCHGDVVRFASGCTAAILRNTAEAAPRSFVRQACVCRRTTAAATSPCPGDSPPRSSALPGRRYCRAMRFLLPSASVRGIIPPP